VALLDEEATWLRDELLGDEYTSPQAVRRMGDVLDVVLDDQVVERVSVSDSEGFEDACHRMACFRSVSAIVFSWLFEAAN
jgi:hypothetical protein